MFQFIQNIFSIKDLRDRILFTILMMIVFRVGAHIPSPFVDVEAINAANASGALGSMFGLADMFTGGAFSQVSIMALGIMPYITASIILQVLTVGIPQLEKMAKEGEAGRKKITQITRYATVGLAAAQGLGFALFILNNDGGRFVQPFMRDLPLLFVAITVVSITTGTVFLMWLGEKITERGIGNGISLLIAVGIASAYIPNIQEALLNVRFEVFQPIWIPIVAAICIASTILIILIQEGARKIPIQHAKQAAGRKMQIGQTNYLPLKINMAGVMPVIFSSAILQLPTTLFGWIGAGNNELGTLGELFNPMSRYNPYDMLNMTAGGIYTLLKAVNLYTFLFIVLTAGFCFLYTAIIFNPQDVADNLRRVGAYVPGYRPGKPTADYLDRVMTRITFVGAIFLCSVAVLPQIMMVSFGLPFSLADFAGGTGLIIVVAVTLDTMKQVESRMLMRHYDGFQSRRQAGGGRRWKTSTERKS